MFDSDFYATVLPDLIKSECAAEPGSVPVVELRLSDGTTLDVCHILALGPGWLAAACYSSDGPPAALTTEFVRHELVMRITVSMQGAPARHQLGFDVSRNSAARRIGPNAGPAPKRKRTGL